MINPNRPTREQLRIDFIENKMSVAEIREKYKCTRRAVEIWIKKYHLEGQIIYFDKENEHVRTITKYNKNHKNKEV